MTDVRAFKLLRGCIDCGYNEQADALQFDHVRGIKKHKIAAIASAGIGSTLFQQELAKCEVRCANCHAIRTAKNARAKIASRLAT